MKILGYRYLPLNFYILYSLFVFMCLFVGPIEYRDMDYLVLLPFVACVLFLFVVGYMLGARGKLHTQRMLHERQVTYRRVARYITIMLVLGSIGSFMHLYSFFSSGGGLNLNNIGENYVAGYAGYERGQAKVDLMYIVNILDQALSVIVILLCFYYFTVMRKLSRLAFLFVVATYLLVNVIGSGKQKYLGDVVIFTFFCLMVNLAAKRVRVKASLVILSGLAIFIVFMIFIEVLRQRYAAAGISLDNIHEKVHQLISWDADSTIFRWVSIDYGLALGIFVGYFTNGLYGLYLSLTLPFEWTYFVGNSYSLARIAEIVVSSDGLILDQTYPYRVGLEYGWGLDKWHSLFAWLASDITFIGVLALTPIFSFFYARLWLQSVRASNPLAGPLFIYFSMGLIFSYSNNQIMHGLAGVLVLFALLIGWSWFEARGSRPSVDQAQLNGDAP